MAGLKSLKKRRRIQLIFLAFALVGLTTGLVGFAFRDGINFFRSPSQVLSDPPPLAPKITYQKHAETLPGFIAMIPGTKAEDYPDGEAAAAEERFLEPQNLPGCDHEGRERHGHEAAAAKLAGARYGDPRQVAVADQDEAGLYGERRGQAEGDGDRRLLGLRRRRGHGRLFLEETEHLGGVVRLAGVGLTRR